LAEAGEIGPIQIHPPWRGARNGYGRPRQPAAAPRRRDHGTRPPPVG
jgi:hypothetical protein